MYYCAYNVYDDYYGEVIIFILTRWHHHNHQFATIHAKMHHVAIKTKH